MYYLWLVKVEMDFGGNSRNMLHVSHGYERATLLAFLEKR